MSETFYRQCRLRRDRTHTTSWVPEKLAQKGREVRLKKGNEWEDGWIIESVGPRAPGGLVRDYEDQHRRHRKITDI